MSSPVDGPPRMFSSLHTHSRYCDGHGEIDEYARAAAQAGLAAYGASGHAPLPFACDYAMPLAALDAYRADVRRAADRYAGELPVFLGLELDYLPGLSAFYERELLRRDFDYFVCSVHYVGGDGADPWAYDESEAVFAREVAARYRGDARPIVADYYRRVRLMVEEVSTWQLPTFVGHLDRIALWNRDDRYFSTGDRWYIELVDDALDAIQKAGLAVELNTSGWDKPAGAPNPNLAILRRCARRGIASLLSADAHRPANVDRRFAEGARLLVEAGIRQVLFPDRAGWQRVDLPASAADEVR
ncbi:MAG: histidinol-phosphatase [Chloroflexota bacterium]